MTYAQNLKTTGISALATLRACYRQSVRDSWKIYNVLTGDRAMQTYRFIGRLVLVAMGLAVMAGMYSRKLWDRYAQPWIDQQVESSLTEQGLKDLLSDMTGATVDPEHGKRMAKVQLYNGHERHWQEIDEETYNWLLGCVPTISHKGPAFLNSEPYSATIDGTNIYMACTMIGDRFWFRLCTVAEFKTFSQANMLPLPAIAPGKFAYLPESIRMAA